MRVEHRFDPRPLTFLEEAVIAHSGIVDEKIDPIPLSADRGKEGVEFRRLGQIKGVAADGERRASEFFRDRLEAVEPASDENERACPRRELPGELAPESGRGAGDERRTTMEGLHVCAGFPNARPAARADSAQTFSCAQ